MHADFPNDGLFPKRGPALNYFINGKSAIKRGEPGDPAVIIVNGEAADMHTPIRANDVIKVTESTVGKKAELTLAELPEFKSLIPVTVNGSRILLPKFAEVNGEIKTAYYNIEDGDEIIMRDHYTVKEVREFMDVILEKGTEIRVNNEIADDDTPVYDNFSIKWGLKEEVYEAPEEKNTIDSGDNNDRMSQNDVSAPEDDEADEEEYPDKEDAYEEAVTEKVLPRTLIVNVNGDDIKLTGKSSYVFVDIFDHIDFDLKSSGGRNLVTTLNGSNAAYMQELSTGDKIVVRWEER